MSRVTQLFNSASGANTLRNNISNLRLNYTYPSWFENTIKWTESGQISETEFYKALDNLSNRGLLVLKGRTTPKLIPNPNAPTVSKSFESLYPKQTEQLIKIGQDTTALGEIVTRQDATDAGFRRELDQALLGREANQANITANTSKIEELFSGQQKFHDMHIDQESRITRNAEMIGQKADKGHKHACTDCGECEWYDIFCKMGSFQSEVGKYAIIAGVGIVAFFLLKKRLGL
jgi:hypothetical protein